MGPGAGTGRSLLLRIVLLAGFATLSPGEWHEPGAPLRFTLQVDAPPTHEAAGFFVHLPDGGVLPRPFPATQVVTEGGKRLESYVLWHNPVGGLALAFASPPDLKRKAKMYVYVGSAARLRLWTPESGLKPSTLLCADPTTDQMEAAHKLGRLGAVGPTTHSINHAGHKRAPLMILGDMTGRPRPCVFYMLAHLETRDPGRTWIAPFIEHGQGEVWVNGKKIEPVKRIDKWGGTGAWVDLPRGLNRFEFFHTASGSADFASRKTGGLQYLTWRTPKASMDELGGVRSDKVPMSGTSRMETRVINNDEIARSGRCRVLSVESRKGDPVASARAIPKQMFWFEDETPIALYELTAVTQGNPEGTRYNWQLDNRGTTATGAVVPWLFPAMQEYRVGLSAKNGGGLSRMQHAFFSYTGIRSNLNHPPTRKAFFDASLSMFKAAPRNVDPMVACGTGYWNTLMRCASIGEGFGLLHHLFSERQALLRARLSPPERTQLLDLLLDMAPRQDPAAAAAWVNSLRRKTTDREIVSQLRLAEAEIQMHYLGNTNQVAGLLSPLLSQSRDAAELARIRMGDLAFLSGDLNRATAMYAAVQNRVRHHRNNSESSAVQGTPSAGRLARSKAEMEAERARRLELMKSAVKEGEVDNWKLNAFLGVSVSETVRALIDQGQMLAARETLQAWERQFPLSKVSGDYVLQEARYYMKLNDWVRARGMLQSYCEMVDASSYIPDAALLLLDCMIQMKDPEENIRSYCEEMGAQLEFHPSGKAFKAYLERN